MTMKSDVTSIADKIGGTIGDKIERLADRAEALPDQVREARATISGWNNRARRLVQDRPGTVLIGAVVLGFVLARVARHA